MFLGLITELHIRTGSLNGVSCVLRRFSHLSQVTVMVTSCLRPLSHRPLSARDATHARTHSPLTELHLSLFCLGFDIVYIIMKYCMFFMFLYGSIAV